VEQVTGQLEEPVVLEGVEMEQQTPPVITVVMELLILAVVAVVAVEIRQMAAAAVPALSLFLTRCQQAVVLPFLTPLVLGLPQLALHRWNTL
jgi:hypothetical protein